MGLIYTDIGFKRGSLDASVGGMTHAHDLAVFVQPDVFIVDSIPVF